MRPNVIFTAILEFGYITTCTSDCSSVLFRKPWETTHLIVRQISVLIVLLAVYREGEVIVNSGRKDNFEADIGGDTFVILALVKEDFSVLFHT